MTVITNFLKKDDKNIQGDRHEAVEILHYRTMTLVRTKTNIGIELGKVTCIKLPNAIQEKIWSQPEGLPNNDVTNLYKSSCFLVHVSIKFRITKAQQFLPLILTIITKNL